MTRNRLWRDSILIGAFALALLSSAFCGDAFAQVAQPQYVRPSKGAPITVFPGPEGRGLPANTPVTTSAVFDFSAFDAAQIAITFRDAGGTPCALGFTTWSLSVYGGPDKNTLTLATSWLPLPDPNSIKTQNSTFAQEQVYEVGYLPTYIILVTQTGALAPGTPASCRMLVTMIPKPFANPYRTFGDNEINTPVPPLASGGPRPNLIGGDDYNPDVHNGKAQILKVDSSGRIYNVPSPPVGPVALGGVIPLAAVTNAVGGTTVLSFVPLGVSRYYTARIQNVSQQPIVCAAAGVASAGAYSCAMKPMSGAATYDGGECTLFDVPGTSAVNCRSLGVASGTVALYRAVYVSQ